MRRIRLDAADWLWTVVAAWALLIAIVALLGFGARTRLLPNDASQVPPLPAIAQADAKPALGPQQDYAVASQRPLFYPDRKPIQVHVPGSNADAQPLNVVLTSVIITPTVQMAIVQDAQTHLSYRAKQGESLNGPYAGWKLVSLTPRSAAFDNGQGQTTLDLRVFNGQGGQPPTRMGLTPEAVAGGALVQPALPGGMAMDPNAPQPNILRPSNMMPMPGNPSQQAERIRQRIEQRRREAQAAREAANESNQKVK